MVVSSHQSTWQKCLHDIRMKGTLSKDRLTATARVMLRRRTLQCSMPGQHNLPTPKFSIRGKRQLCFNRMQLPLLVRRLFSTGLPIFPLKAGFDADSSDIANSTARSECDRVSSFIRRATCSSCTHNVCTLFQFRVTEKRGASCSKCVWTACNARVKCDICVSRACGLLRCSSFASDNFREVPEVRFCDQVFSGRNGETRQRSNLSHIVTI